MKFFKKIQNLDIFWRKFMVVVIVVGVGIALGVLVGKNFQKRLVEFKKEKFLEKLNFPELKSSVEELRERREKMKEEFKKLAEILNKIPTTTTTTNEEF